MSKKGIHESIPRSKTLLIRKNTKVRLTFTKKRPDDPTFFFYTFFGLKRQKWNVTSGLSPSELCKISSISEKDHHIYRSCTICEITIVLAISSINFLYPLLPALELVPISHIHWVRGGEHPGQSIAGQHRDMQDKHHSHTSSHLGAI
ncbi:hypothetical protein CHARACLAT_004239 [Characodon lateralis]|uniref:Uncharacterized protein n=1 Tax=Characodon lateralis TaxID=208331 RepID=A0ABU7ES18_9TELE|nr:hypothetical protein [Characodon lateralis]